jgi:hypothetical protein
LNSKRRQIGVEKKTNDGWWIFYLKKTNVKWWIKEKKQKIYIKDVNPS